MADQRGAGRCRRDHATKAASGWVIANSITLDGLVHAAEVIIDPITLNPLSSHLAVEGPAINYSIDAVYDRSANQVKLVAHTVQGDQQLAVKLPAGHFIDNEQLLTTLRAMPLAEGFRTEVNLINTAGGQSLAIAVAVTAVETVMVDATGLAGAEQRAYRVSLLGGAQTAWIAVDAPNLLLKYDNGQRQMVLTSYSAGAR